MRAYQLLAAIITLFTVSFSQGKSLGDVEATRSRLPLVASHEILNGQVMQFVEHVGPVDDRFGTTLALNTPYEPIVSLREQIRSQLGLENPLLFFTGFVKLGEAHVTTVTPIEYHDTLRGFVSPAKMNAIAIEHDIQSSDLQAVGIGHAQANLSGVLESTYFVIVRSENLLRIRRAIYEEYVRAGGPKNGWDPEHFYPHITIGYTARDLHESDGVVKDAAHSLDQRFELYIDGLSVNSNRGDITK